jgi:hypothetical protein
MPFELGLACAIKEQSGQHDFLILEKRPFRLHRNLSDVGGIDPKIHRGTVSGTIGVILEVLERPGGNPSAADVMKLYRRMMRLVPQLKARHGNHDLFSTRVYGDLVTSGWVAAKEMGLS